MTKKRLSIFYFIFLLVSCLFITLNQPVHAKELTALKTSYYEPYNFTLELKNNQLLITDTPETYESYNLFFKLFSETTGRDIWESIYSPVHGIISVPMSNYNDGIYRLYLFVGRDNDAMYQGYWWDAGAPRIKKDGDSYSFILGEYYDEITQIHDNILSYDYALDYYKKPSYWIESDDKSIIKKAQEITSNATTDYEKIYQIYEWVIQNIYYDYDGLSTGKMDVSAVSVLKTKKTVCQGYADLTAALLRSLNIPAMVVGGNAATPIDKNYHNHAWNMVYADGRWIFLDSTWDSHNRYENGTYTKYAPNKNRMWFDMSVEMIASSHYILDDLYYPVLSDMIGNNVTSDIDLTYGPVSYQLIQPEIPKGFSYEYRLSEGNKICSIDSKGKITFKALPKDYSIVLDIYLRTPLSSEIIASIDFYPYDNCILESQTLDAMNIKIGKRYTFAMDDLYYMGSSVKYKITYSVSDENILSVSKKGVVKGKKKGKATVKAVIQVGSRKFTYKQRVTVK